MKNAKLKIKWGFTLVELMAVLAVITALAVALPAQAQYFKTYPVALPSGGLSSSNGVSVASSPTNYFDMTAAQNLPAVFMIGLGGTGTGVTNAILGIDVSEDNGTPVNWSLNYAQFLCFGNNSTTNNWTLTNCPPALFHGIHWIRPGRFTANQTGFTNFLVLSNFNLTLSNN